MAQNIGSGINSVISDITSVGGDITSFAGGVASTVTSGAVLGYSYVTSEGRQIVTTVTSGAAGAFGEPIFHSANRPSCHSKNAQSAPVKFPSAPVKFP
ncbi:hypothetical protein FA10DRAFT_268479 [Acaromyces ingoldii]|uniref:Uncharacterized protein n=1 Tax=Acaromyces ingoldii TaxID=215250 RepID=A0A316YI28_9BASI|nr:hypothetical protein FA10DRAFT_268479 [Acaromyces ingoldii]PWN88278.1 hypothetical protein FA10DRAFT_268479 [Acaromyces ingoldii]